jgi:predicted Fe-Mo cluster-binding NifX family protein
MRIAVATDDETNVCGHVDKCKYFMVLDIENGQIQKKEIRKNSYTNHHQLTNDNGSNRKKHTKGHGNSDFHKLLAEGLKDCDYLVSYGMGKKLMQDLEANSIEPMVTVETNVESAAIKLEMGKLKTNDSLVCK